MRSSSRRTRWTILVATVVAVVFAGSFVVVASAANSSPSSFVATSPLRVLDTRPSASLGPNETRTLSLAANVPVDATAVAINVTVTGGTTTSWLTVFRGGSPLPFASSLNWSDSG